MTARRRRRLLTVAAVVTLALAVAWRVGLDLPTSAGSQTATRTAVALDRVALAVERAGATRDRAVASTPNVDATPSQAPAPRPDRENAEARRGYDAGLAAVDRWRAAWDQHFRRRFGDDIAALMRAPLATGWPALEALAREGDRDAAAAMNELLGLCPAPRPNGRSYIQQMLSRWTQGQSDFDRGYVSGLATGEVTYFAARRRECAAVGATHAALLRLVVERLRLMGADGFTLPADGGAPSADWADALDRAFPPSPRRERDDPGPWVIEPRDLPTGAALTALRVTTFADPHAFQRVFQSCVAPCDQGGAEPLAWMDAIERDAWLARAAQLGLYGEPTRAAMQAEARGNRVEALAWREYDRWLMQTGCSATMLIAEYATTARHATALRTALSAREIAEAEGRAAAWQREFGPAALTLRPCGR